MSSQPVTATRADSDFNGTNLAAVGAFALATEGFGVMVVLFEGVVAAEGFAGRVTLVFVAVEADFDAAAAEELCIARAVNRPTLRTTRVE